MNFKKWLKINCNVSNVGILSVLYYVDQKSKKVMVKNLLGPSGHYFVNMYVVILQTYWRDLKDKSEFDMLSHLVLHKNVTQLSKDQYV